MTLISQTGSDYQLAQITLDAGNARDIMLMLLDIHAVLDHLYLDGTGSQATGPAQDYLRESGSPYTLPTLIAGLDDVITQLIQAMRHAVAPRQPARRQHPPPPHLTSRIPPPGGARSKENSHPGTPEGGARSKENSGASWG